MGHLSRYCHISLPHATNAEQSTYRPLVTLFIEQMSRKSSQGWLVVDGLDVLVDQGVAQFEIFTKRPAPVHIMRDAVRKRYPNNPVV